MATVQKTISESGSLTTRTLVTTISAPGIRQNAEISVSPNVDASKISYTINEGAETLTVTLTNVGYTSSQSGTPIVRNLVSQDYYDVGNGMMHLTCDYGDGYTISGVVPYFQWCSSTETWSGPTQYHFNFTITITYKTFPEFAVKVSNQKRKSIDGWAKISNTKRQLIRFWVRVNGNLKEV